MSEWGLALVGAGSALAAAGTQSSARRLRKLPDAGPRREGLPGALGLPAGRARPGSDQQAPSIKSPGPADAAL